MQLTYFVSISVIYLSCVVFGQSLQCTNENKTSGQLSRSHRGFDVVQNCWIIEVPRDSYIRIDVKSLSFYDLPCTRSYIEVSVAGSEETFKFCPEDKNRKPITALNDVNITSSFTGKRIHPIWYTCSFSIDYHIENLVCAQKNNFRCSDHFCIHQYQVCDGLKDCENGSDEVGCETGVNAIKGVNSSREDAIAWLKNQRRASFGWGRNTHRAITSLYLVGDSYFDGDLAEELTVKQLELQTSLALLRNSTDPLSVSELSMFINALLVTCHNPRKIYGYDLLQILGDRVASLKSPCPGCYLTLCNANWTFSETNEWSLLNILHGHSEYPFIIDVHAMAVMALTCIKNKMEVVEDDANSTKIYYETIQKFIRSQKPDGSFGNVYTTALVTQALLSSGQGNNSMWNLTSAVKYLMKHQNVSADFISTYLTLPILNDKTLVHLSTVKCSRHRDKNDDINDVTNQLGKSQVQYSLYIGDLKDVVHTIYLRVPVNSSVYDVMRMAQVEDPKYKFLHRNDAGHVYVYEIAGIMNDPEALKFWLLYTKVSINSNKVLHHTRSPDKLIMKDGGHLIMWFKTVEM